MNSVVEAIMKKSNGNGQMKRGNGKNGKFVAPKTTPKKAPPKKKTAPKKKKPPVKNNGKTRYA